MDEAIQIIRTADVHEASLLAHLIRSAYGDVATRFNLTPQNCPKHPSNCTPDWVKMGFVEQETKAFPHLPFEVSLMAYAF